MVKGVFRWFSPSSRQVHGSGQGGKRSKEFRISAAQRRALTAIPAVLLLVAMQGGWAGHASFAAQHVAASKGTLTIAATQDIYGWDPTASQPTYQAWAEEAVYDYIFRCDALAHPHPDIATSWKFNNAHTKLVLHIRPGMKFTDGIAVDAAAVKATLLAVATPGSRLEGIKVSTQGSLTDVLTMPKPTPLLEFLMCGQMVASAKDLASGHLKRAPVGSGPYTFDKAASTPGSVYTFVKNPSFWDSKDFPYQKLVVKVFPSETARFDALKTGQIDGAPITAATYNAAKAAGLKVMVLHGETTRLLITDHLGKKIRALGNANVRRAMNMVFDKNAIVKGLYLGHAAPAYQIFRPGTTAFIKGLKDPYPYNVAKAKALMAKAGYKNGFSLQIPFIAGIGYDQLVPYVISQLGLLNIKAKQVTLSGPNEITNELSGKYPVPLWPLGNYGNSIGDISDYILQAGIWNVEHEPDATVAKLWQKVLVGTKKQSAQAQQAINRYVINQAWFVPMAYPDLFYAYNPKAVSIPKSSDPGALQPMLWDFK